MSKHIEEVVKQVFASVLELPPDTDFETLAQRDLEVWDSLAHVMLCTALESEFDLQIELDDAVELTTYRTMVDYLNRRLAKTSQ